jgi:K+-sensing histidine kinase KdpD
MTTERLVLRHRAAVLSLAVVAPLGLSVLLGLVPALIENTSAALLLVLLVVGAASTGLRPAGLLAAVASALSFDYFLTAPFHTLRILDRADLETAVGLLLVGVAVTELALWGRRQQARASEQCGYLTGVLEAVGQAGVGSGSVGATIRHIELELVKVLDLDAARFHRDAEHELPRIEPDGRITAHGRPVDIDRLGLPTDTELSLPVRLGDESRGEFRLTAASHVARPGREQLRVAVLLADQAARALIQRTGSAT